DRIYSQAGGGYGGSLTYGYFSTTNDGEWKGALTTLKRGYGCWYRISSGMSSFSWTNSKPYGGPPY
ncbi:MAG: hypothetical protein P8123_10550, partial [bacterium]